MNKTITKVIKTGKATVEIIMTYYNEKQEFGNHLETKEIAKLVKAKLYVDNKLIETSSDGFVYASGTDDEKGRFGNIYLPIARVTDILEAIKEMHAELSKEFATKTPIEIRAEENEKMKLDSIKLAKKTMAEIETRKTEILSVSQENVWKINYNNANNEGEEGYIPTRATLEDIEEAKIILESERC